MWLAVRALGRHQEPQFTTIAHSAPIYVVVDGEPTWKRDAVADLVAYQRAQMQQMLTTPIEPNQDLETWETRDTLVEEWKRQVSLLKPQVDAADRKYQELLDRLQKSSHP